MKIHVLPAREPGLCAPLTANRDLGDCWIANVPMRDLFNAELRRAGFDIVASHEVCPRTVLVPIDMWIDVGALVMLGKNSCPTKLIGLGGEVLAWIGCQSAEECHDTLQTEASYFAITYPWDLLRLNEEVVKMADEKSCLGEVSPLATVRGAVRIGKGAKILEGCVIEGPVVIGAGTTVGPNALIRGASAIGSKCWVGHCAEVKNSIVFPHTYISRHCYVGDSIIGAHVTLGAGTRTENHRHDGRHHVSMVRGNPVETGRLKLGAFVGDGVKTGVNTSLAAGVKIGVARQIKPGTYVESDFM